MGQTLFIMCILLLTSALFSNKSTEEKYRKGKGCYYDIRARRNDEKKGLTDAEIARKEKRGLYFTTKTYPEVDVIDVRSFDFDYSGLSFSPNRNKDKERYKIEEYRKLGKYSKIRNAEETQEWERWYEKLTWEEKGNLLRNYECKVSKEEEQKIMDYLYSTSDALPTTYSKNGANIYREYYKD